MTTSPSPGPPPAIELRHLQYFVALAEERHFGRAAERVYMTQSPFSRQIRQLEVALGCRLVDRGSRVTGLTPAGEVVADHAARVLADVDGLVEAARRAEAGEVGSLRIGFVSEVTDDLLPRSLTIYRRRYPEVHLELHEARSTPQLGAVRHGELDVAFLRSPIDLAGIDYQPLVTETLLLAIPVGDDEGVPSSLADCSERPFLLPSAEAAAGLRRDVVACCRVAGFDPIVARDDATLPALLLHVAAHEGIALVPGSITHQYPVPGVSYVELGEPRPRSEIGIAWRLGEPGAILANYLAVIDELRRSLAGQDDVWPERHFIGPSAEG